MCVSPYTMINNCRQYCMLLTVNDQVNKDGFITSDDYTASTDGGFFSSVDPLWKMLQADFDMNTDGRIDQVPS